MSQDTDDQPDTLYLIDGHAQIFRSYYAIRGGMTSPVTGEPSHASFAFTGMLIKLFREFAPQYVAMAIDTDKPTYREALFPDYKAQREAPPEDFAPQVDRILEITRLFGIPVLQKDGAEADDLIATVVERLRNDPAYQNVHIRIVSKDKDLEQLLGDRVTMFDIHTDTTIDQQWLKEKRGLTPDQVVDALALMGDTVDNIPGVEGIGEKTAAKLIGEYGSIDGLLAHLDQMKGKRKEKLEEAQDFLPTARELVTLNREVDIDFDMADAKVERIDATGLKRIFKELGFNRHSRDFDALLDKQPALQAWAVGSEDSGQSGFATSLFGEDDDAAQSNAADAHGTQSTRAGYDYRAITTRDALDELVETLKTQSLISVDVETVGLGHKAELCGLCLAWQEKAGVYIPIRSPEPSAHLDPETVIEALRPALEDPELPKCGHNLKYDFLVLKHAGVFLRGIVFDTMVGGYLAGAPGQALGDMALAQLNHEMMPITDLIGPRGRGVKQKTMDQVPLDQITPYAAEDADISLRLYHVLRPQLEAMGLTNLAQRIEMPLVEVLAMMEYHGIKVDAGILDNQRQQLQERIDALRDDIHTAAGRSFNVDSPKQLAEVLFTYLELPVIKRTKTGSSTDIEVLEKLAERDDLDETSAQVPRLVVEYRQLTKLVGTYLQALTDAIDPDTGRVHATFHQTGTATGRLSSSGPNLQNIPVRTDLGRQIRKAFVADAGKQLVCADYSQIELRLLAHLSNDEALIDAFNNDQDIHTAVAAQVFGASADDVTSEQRGHAKTINFGIVYGVTPYGLARRIEGLDVDSAKALIEDYRQRFSGIDRFLQACIEEAETHGYVTTMLGRRRKIEQISARNPQTRALGERLAINTVVQGSAADLIKAAMVSVYRRLTDQASPAKLLLQIHDELIAEAPSEAAADIAAVLVAEMEKAMSLKVPLRVETGIGSDWYSAK
jgi:DNA polymerase-1